ncbi:MAG TPA: DinB family protein [Candidatus Dormibacteraeota bacterium]|nr:DinB family protein [Candidatus Dormibacteraeota bacterium]
MTGKTLLELQLTGSLNILRDRLASVTDQEWIAREIPGTSLPGFTFWHAARIIDWGIHCAIQGVPEVADRPQWSGLHATELAYGAGISQQEADSVAHSVNPTDMVGYIAEVRQAALGWFGDLSDQDLDRAPDLEAHQRVKPRYLTPEVWSEVRDLAGLPTWQILARPCVSHIRVHAGEIDIVLQSLRAKKTE